MSRSRTGLRRHASSLGTLSLFSRDRQDGGGGGDDFEPDDGDDSGAGNDDTDDDTDDDSGDDDAPKVPTKADGTPYTQEDVDKLASSLRAARRDARGKGKAGKDDATGDGREGDDAPDADAIRAEVESEITGQWSQVVVNERARSALVEAGLIGKPDRLLKLLDHDEIDVTLDNGTLDVDGLDDQVAELKREYPHLFRKKGTRRLDAANGRDGGGRDRSKMTATEQQAAYLRGEL